ncbi:MAG TPA: hypothetical protein VF796_21810 [Humisphaera sp.]
MTHPEHHDPDDDNTLDAGPVPERTQLMPYKDEAERRAYDAAYKRLRRAGGPTLSTPLVPPDVRLQTARDVLDLLAQQVNDVQADPDVDVLDRARTVGFLASIALRAIEAGDQQARIEALERALKLRADEQKKTAAAAAARNGRSNAHGSH